MIRRDRVITDRPAPCFATANGRAVRCACGASLAAAATGRRRLTCSPACRRRREFTWRKIRRRVEWMHAWALEDGRGQYSRAEIQREIGRAVRELRALLPIVGLTWRDVRDQLVAQ